MATFTMLLQDVLETLYNETLDIHSYEVERGEFTFGGEVYKDLPILPDNGEALGLAQYPIFDEAYRPILNGKIIDEYFMWEIGAETIDVFKLNLRKRMQQIMPYYNKLYEIEAIDYSPLSTIDIHTVGSDDVQSTEMIDGKTTGETVTGSKSRAVSSTTPQTMLSGNGNYATSGTDSKSDGESLSEGTQESTNNTDTTANRDSRTSGYQGAASDLIVKNRAAQINIDTMILGQVQDCFMLLLNNGDSYSRNSIWNGWNF